MAPVTIKCAPTVEDRTGENGNIDNYEESWEAVLFEKKEEDVRSVQSKLPPPSRSVSSKTERAEIIKLLEQRRWDDLIAKVKLRPETASVVLSNGTAALSPLDISGNYVIHEAVKNDPPLSVVKTLLSANQTALKSRGNWGYLPIHYACTAGASADVVEALLEGYPNGVMVKDSNDHMLPLHLACKRGAEADVLMALLTAYPDATSIKDDFGQTPLDYGRNIRSRDIRSDTLSCLEIGRWLCAAANAAKARAEGHFDTKLQTIKEGHRQEIDALQQEHNDEKARLLNFIKVHEMNAKDLENKLANRNTKVEELEQAVETSKREFESKLETERTHLAKTEVALDVKSAEVKDTMKRLDESRVYGESLENQLEDAKARHVEALDEIDTLSIRLENLESLLNSIRHLASSGGPTSCRELREGAPNNEKMNKFRAKALKIGKKARHGKESKTGGSEICVSAAKKETPSRDLGTNTTLPDPNRASPEPHVAPPTVDE